MCSRTFENEATFKWPLSADPQTVATLENLKTLSTSFCLLAANGHTRCAARRIMPYVLLRGTPTPFQSLKETPKSP